jgi:CelD/BcsL family acetyltransferase involved in cellulose biosynthesis
MTATVLTEWSDPPFAHAPVAPETGPFPRRPFLETWWRHVSASDRLALITHASGTLPLRLSGGSVLFCGDADLTDYHSPLGETAVAIEAAAGAFSGHPYVFDSLPEEAAAALHAALDEGGHTHRFTKDEITALIDLPDSAEAWLAGLRKKDRHETRRKRRAFGQRFGTPQLERRTDRDAVVAFAELHRSSAGAKGGFMTPEREEFFADLVAEAGASVELLVGTTGPLAAGFGFAEPNAYYLYNSAYASEASPSSPGIVLLAALIESLIDDGVRRLDLLKGDEPYKFRLGATPRQLYRIEGSFA